MTLPAEFEIPADWQPAIQQIVEIIDDHAQAGHEVAVIPTRNVGRRPSTTDGVAGGYYFAQAAMQHLATRSQGDATQDWSVSYDHAERAFVAVRRSWIRLTTGLHQS